MCCLKSNVWRIGVLQPFNTLLPCQQMFQDNEEAGIMWQGKSVGMSLKRRLNVCFFVRKSIRALHQSTADLSLCASEQMFGFLIMQHLGFLTRAYDTITRPLFTPNPKYFAKHTELHGVLTCVSFRHVTKLPSCNLQKWLLLISFIILKWLQECVCVCVC